MHDMGRLLEAMDEICSPGNFRVYEYPPPTMVKACEVFMGDHEDAVESTLLEMAGKGNSAADLADAVCLTRTGVCKGVDLSPTGAGEPTIYMDNKPLDKEEL
jgi:hypothetical protein